MLQDEEDRFADFVRAHSATLFRTAYLMTGDYQRSEDLLQTTLVRLYQRWPRVQVMGQPVAYSRKVLVNQALSWWRRRSSREEPRLIPDEASSACELVEGYAEHERVWRAVLSLPPRQRAVVVLRYYEDLPEAEIAEVLEMAPGTVKSHAHAATRRLALLLSEPSVHQPRPAKEATS
jgi:RNA polymerase sigma-70 factor (sigma-E family)